MELHTVTATPGTAPAVPGVASVRVEEGTEPTKGSTVLVTLPPQSFTTVEAALAQD